MNGWPECATSLVARLTLWENTIVRHTQDYFRAHNISNDVASTKSPVIKVRGFPVRFLVHDGKGYYNARELKRPESQPQSTHDSALDAFGNNLAFSRPRGCLLAPTSVLPLTAIRRDIPWRGRSRRRKALYQQDAFSTNRVSGPCHVSGFASAGHAYRHGAYWLVTHPIDKAIIPRVLQLLRRAPAAMRSTTFKPSTSGLIAVEARACCVKGKQTMKL